VHAVYLQKFEDWLIAPSKTYWAQKSDKAELRRAALLLGQLPEGSALLEKLREEVAKKKWNSDYLRKNLEALEENRNTKDRETTPTPDS
jgi:hypothetical protein